MYNDYSIVLTTVALENDAEVLAEKLLQAKLANLRSNPKNQKLLHMERKNRA